MRRIIMIFLGVLLLHLNEREEDGHYYYYLEYSYIDAVLTADTIQNNDLARIVHIYPEGRTHFERIDLRELGDTLEVAAL